MIGPTEIVFRFRNQKEKLEFLKGLLDGFGEEHCNLAWGCENGVPLDDAVVFDVTLPEEDDSEEKYDEFGFLKMGDDFDDDRNPAERANSRGDQAEVHSQQEV